MIDIVVSRFRKNTDWTEKFKRYSNIEIKIYDKEIVKLKKIHMMMI